MDVFDYMVLLWRSRYTLFPKGVAAAFIVSGFIANIYYFVTTLYKRDYMNFRELLFAILFILAFILINHLCFRKLFSKSILITIDILLIVTLAGVFYGNLVANHNYYMRLHH